jgi:acyl carrier protein
MKFLPKGLSDRLRKQPSESARESSDDLSEARLHAELLQLWKKFLKVPDITIDDDFFEKGGDSVLAVDLHIELQRLTGRSLPESMLFEAPTVRELTRQLRRSFGPHRPAAFGAGRA